MQSFLYEKNYPPTVILRHRKENLKKCTLSGLEAREDFRFYTYPIEHFPKLPGYILLTVDAPSLTSEQNNNGLLILDATWRYAEKMFSYAVSQQSFIYRSIPKEWRTAYPRRQTDCPIPEQGLASIEAIFAAYYILGRDTRNLLDGYYWGRAFLEKNLFYKF